MDDNQEPIGEAEQQDAEVQSEVAAPEVDYFLQSLVYGVNTTDMKLSINLNVGGTVISGMLIGGKTYFEEVSRAFTSAFVDSTEEERMKIHEAMFQPYIDLYVERDDEGKPDPNMMNPQYIHLRNARIFQAGQPPFPANGMLWRGRLTAVEGFSLGVMTHTVS